MERSGYFTFFVAAILSNLRSRVGIPLAALVIISLVLNGIITNAQATYQVGGVGADSIRGMVTFPSQGCTGPPTQGSASLTFGAGLNADGTVTAGTGEFSLSGGGAAYNGIMTSGAIAYPGVSGSSFSLTGTLYCGGNAVGPETATIAGTCGTNQQVTLESTSVSFSGTGNVDCNLFPTQTTITSATDGNGKPVGNGGSTSSTSITFQVTVIKPGTLPIAGFQCALDASAFATCASTDPGTVSYYNLAGGQQHTFTVRAVDTGGRYDPNPTTFSWTIQPADQPPVAVATSNPTPGIVGNTVTLDGSLSDDPDGDSITNYQWQQVPNGAPTVTLIGPNSATPTFVAPAQVPTIFTTEGALHPTPIPLQFSLVVTDSRGTESQPATVSVTIQCDQATEDNVPSDFKLSAIEAALKVATFDESATRFQHWLAGSGNPLPFDSTQPLDLAWLKSRTTIQNAVTAQQQQFETAIINLASTLPVGQTTTYTFPPIPDPISQQTEEQNLDYDLKYAVGTIDTFRHMGTFQITHDKQNHFTITGQVSHSFTDKYQWRAGTTFGADGFTFTGDEALLVEKCRGAKPFDQNAFWIQNLNADGALGELRAHIGKKNDNKWIWSDPPSTAQIPPPTLPFSS